MPIGKRWWMSLRGLLRILAQHKTKLEHVEAVLMHVSERDLKDHIA